MKTQRTSFENLRVYQLAEGLADAVWEVVTRWDHFSRNTVGKQLVESADSIGANIAEEAGRYGTQDNKRFGYFARGSLNEVKHWLRRAYRRNLLTEQQVGKLKPLIDELAPKLNAYINSLKQSAAKGTTGNEQRSTNNELSNA